MLQRLLDVKRRIRTLLMSECRPSHCYNLGMAFAIFSIALVLYSDSLTLSYIVLGLGSTLISFGFLWDFFRFFKKSTNTNVFFSLTAAIASSAITVSVSAAVADHVINHATQLNPAYFNHSANLITALATPFVAAHLIAVGLLVFYLFAALTLIVTVPMTVFLSLFGHIQTQRDREFLMIPRIFASIVLSTQLVALLDIIPQKTGGEIKVLAQFLVFTMDHHRFGSCENVLPGQRFKDVGNDRISIATYDGQFRFSIETCQRSVDQIKLDVGSQPSRSGITEGSQLQNKLLQESN